MVLMNLFAGQQWRCRNRTDTVEKERVDKLRELHRNLYITICRRRKWQPTPVLLPGESRGWRSLVGCRLWGRTESDTTEVT